MFLVMGKNLDGAKQLNASLPHGIVLSRLASISKNGPRLKPETSHKYRKLVTYGEYELRLKR